MYRLLDVRWPCWTSKPCRRVAAASRAVATLCALDGKACAFLLADESSLPRPGNSGNVTRGRDDNGIECAAMCSSAASDSRLSLNFCNCYRKVINIIEALRSAMTVVGLSLDFNCFVIVIARISEDF